jgi:hypothetical protein
MLSLDEARSIVFTQITALSGGAPLDIALIGSPETGGFLVQFLFEGSINDNDVQSPDGWVLTVVEAGRAWQFDREPDYT